jgi:hypothetical protein
MLGTPDGKSVYKGFGGVTMTWEERDVSFSIGSPVSVLIEGVSVTNTAIGDVVWTGGVVGAFVIGLRKVGTRVGWLPKGGVVGRFVGGRKVGT